LHWYATAPLLPPRRRRIRFVPFARTSAAPLTAAIRHWIYASPPTYPSTASSFAHTFCALRRSSPCTVLLLAHLPWFLYWRALLKRLHDAACLRRGSRSHYYRMLRVFPAKHRRAPLRALLDALLLHPARACTCIRFARAGFTHYAFTATLLAMPFPSPSVLTTRAGLSAFLRCRISRANQLRCLPVSLRFAAVWFNAAVLPPRTLFSRACRKHTLRCTFAA